MKLISTNASIIVDHDNDWKYRQLYGIDFQHFFHLQHSQATYTRSESHGFVVIIGLARLQKIKILLRSGISNKTFLVCLREFTAVTSLKLSQRSESKSAVKKVFNFKTFKFRNEVAVRKQERKCYKLMDLWSCNVYKNTFNSSTSAYKSLSII
ncbi:CLUMA_CG021469, isoform A [Clunio marinus]|uniref:CLUMA_CG021469, isoform A n=1 Tax=Clunio marinus TaxID=568069 RepID=A0A1J1J7G5_9DIPT|nr:CLUMA_CG021469, isoform A [Clunio marinus]